MGNPVLNRAVISDYRSIFQQWGLIDSQGALAVKPLQDALNKAISEHDSATATDLRNQILGRLDDMTMQQQNFNILKDDLQNQLKGFLEYIARPGVRQALHTGSIKFTFSNLTVQDMLKEDFVSEVDREMDQLLEHYRILIYW
ncbi:Carboxypeptidase [Operophtera brumata]|uniref:Carboxypeptidase n=1 Tax=Operophtera brumata TaxID=104452 RepID=A0A0L7KQY6_OPEBR|nr:Carboxypeptidase [Operophtera brumata]